MLTYDPKNVTLDVDGSVITGYMPGTFINAAKAEADFSPTVGAQGEVTRNRSGHKLGTISFTVKSTSPSNEALTATHMKCKNPELDYLFDLTITDNNPGGLTFSATDCWITKIPDREWSEEVSGRSWEIMVPDYVDEV